MNPVRDKAPKAPDPNGYLRQPVSSGVKIVVVGAGPAGMMSSIRAAQLGQDVILLERNSQPGKKLLLSGKGRCNLTNLCDLDSFLKRFSGGGQFLRSAFNKFFNTDLISFFESRGLKLNVERQERVFPASGNSASVLEVLEKELAKNGVRTIYESRIKDISVENSQIKGVLLEDGNKIEAERVILATGGVSYRFTGSSGDGIDIAKKSGHRVVALKPGLVALVARQEKLVKSLEGLTLKNIRLKFSDGARKEIISEVGELLFTGFGVSGPLVLSLSSRITEWLSENKNVLLKIDLKPGLSDEQLDARILREVKLAPRKNIKNMLIGFLPRRLVDVFIGVLKIAPDKSAAHLTLAERKSIISLLKGFAIDIIKSLPIEEAMITRGGVSLKDINPRTMESRLIKGLYFCGEMIDVDADTGGFNLQAAFSTGYLAGESSSSQTVSK